MGLFGWFHKIFGGSDRKFSGGQNNVKNPVESIWNDPSIFMDVPSHKEDEDMDYAKALSLSEEEYKRRNAADNNSHLEEDEQLARALLESSIMESYPNQNEETYEPLNRECAWCKEEIEFEHYKSSGDLFWHPKCLYCHRCRKHIYDNEFTSYMNEPYHDSCFRNLNVPECDVCKQFIPANDQSGKIEFRSHPFWKNKYCPSHEDDSTPWCCSCERLEPRDENYITLDDGRKLCLECLNFAIMDETECMDLYVDIREFFEGLNMKIEQQIPLLLVERQALNEAIEGEKEGCHNLPETRGLCLSEERIIRKIVGRLVVGPGNRITDVYTKPYRLVRECEVTAILVLYGLPRLLTGQILAHEMMHAWLRLNGYRKLSPKVEEGICQVLAKMWLDSEIISGIGNEQLSKTASSSSSTSASTSSSTKKKGAKSPVEKRFGEFCKYKIKSDTSSAYGDGFKAADQAVEQHGLRRILDHIKYTRSLP